MTAARYVAYPCLRHVAWLNQTSPPPINRLRSFKIGLGKLSTQMAKTTRNYSTTTLKILFTKCSNQCAEPSCTNEIVVGATAYSEPAVVGQICHIYAAADNGPRGKPGLTEKQRNSESNLILLCGHHHPIVDKQWETFPADELLAWKKAHEAKSEKGAIGAAQAQAQTVMRLHAFHTGHTDELINAEIERIRKGRFIADFPTDDAAHELAKRVVTEEYSAGSNAVRARALAWCARLLSLGSHSAYARELLDTAKKLAPTEDADIAEAFLISAKDKSGALALLAMHAIPPAKSAAFRIVANHEGAQEALVWLDRTGFAFNDFDSDGKYHLLTHALITEDWDRAFKWSAKVSEEEFCNTPALLHVVAMTNLVQAVPSDLRTGLLTEVPFEAKTFPLASDNAALTARRRAGELFSRVSDFAQSIASTTASNQASDFTLWLKLRDPRDGDLGMDELRASLRDPAQSLRRINFAIQFGIKLDLAAIERQIEQNIAISGGGSTDEAFARFSLVFAQDNPRAAAEYLARHKEQLHKHLQAGSMLSIEIELLARSGSIDKANRLFAQGVADGLIDGRQESLRYTIVQLGGQDASAGRREMYEKTKHLRDLANLVVCLQEQGAWRDMLPYSEELFSRTGSLEDAVRIAIALTVADDYEKLHAFLSGHLDIVNQSAEMKGFWAWSLYREGHFNAARSILQELSDARDDINDRALRMNIAISSGDWDDLILYTSSEWQHRDQRTPEELLMAGQLAETVNAPHARDLVTMAASIAADNPNILAAAYFHAARAGWEQNATTGQWLSSAAALSKNDGPLKSMSLKELIENKPDWDNRESTVRQQLRDGQLPMCGAAHLLNRSFLDFVLMSALSNTDEPDVRRRAIVYSYSGGRPNFTFPRPDRLALDLGAIVTLERLDLLETVLSTYANVVIPNNTLGWLFHERQRARFHQPSRIKDAHQLRNLIATKALHVLASPAARNQMLELEVGGDLADLLTTVRTKMSSDAGTSRYVVRSAPVSRIGSLMDESADLTDYADVLCSCQAVVAKLQSKGHLTSGEEEVARTYLQLHEHPWPSEPMIADRAELYLDDLSVTYLHTVGLLGKLKAAGLKAFIHEGQDIEANRLIALEALGARQLDAIEAIRRMIAEGIRSGKVRAARSRETKDGDIIRMHPTLAVLDTTEEIDAFVVDDRFINRHMNMDRKDGQTLVMTTLDILQDLENRGIITSLAHYSHRTTLRRAGYQFIPILENELIFHLGNSRIIGNQITETAELRAVRESFLRARMGKMLQLPTEIPWLQNSLHAVTRAIRAIWSSTTDTIKAQACSNWLITLLDIRGFAASAVPGNENNFALHAYAAQIFQLTPILTEMDSDKKSSFLSWLDGALLKNMRDTQPEAFSWLLDKYRLLVTHAARPLDTVPEA